VAVGGRMGQFDTALPPNQRACGIGGESGKRVGGEASTFGWLIIGSLPHRIIGIPQYAGESGPDSVRSSASVHHTSAPVIVRESVERSYSGAEEQGGSWRFGSISLWCLEAYPPPPPLSLGASVRVQDPEKKMVGPRWCDCGDRTIPLVSHKVRDRQRFMVDQALLPLFGSSDVRRGGGIDSTDGRTGYKASDPEFATTEQQSILPPSVAAPQWSIRIRKHRLIILV
jgi:hypothetical protein